MEKQRWRDTLEIDTVESTVHTYIESRSIDENRVSRPTLHRPPYISYYTEELMNKEKRNVAFVWYETFDSFESYAY